MGAMRCGKASAAILCLAVALLLCSTADAFWPIARATWSHPNGPGLLLGGDPSSVGMRLGPTDARPFVAVQGEWRAGRLDAGILATIDLLIPIAGAGIAGSVMRMWDDGSTYAGARGFVSRSCLSLSAGLYQCFHGPDGDRWQATVGIGLGTP